LGGADFPLKENTRSRKIMGFMTNKQKSVIIDIELKLGIVYETPKAGPDAAGKFIGKHIETLRQYNMKTDFKAPPTGKQLRYIKDIEKQLNVSFPGKTLKEACKFIQLYHIEYKLYVKNIY
jgi:hypothetical protein